VAVDSASGAPAIPRARGRKFRSPQAGGVAGKGAGMAAGLLEELGGMLLLTGATLRAMFTPPFPWVDEFLIESVIFLRRTMIPTFFGVIALTFGAGGIQGGNLLNIFGSVDRLGAFFATLATREAGPWATGMIVAGVAGTAVCADLGARKVREELDALAVLGLDPIKTLVVPRFLAIGVLTATMNLLAIAVSLIGGWGAAVLLFGETTSGYFSTMTLNFTLPDLLGSVLKTSSFGFMVAVVCCYKGLNVKGGSVGVGRAVNQAVVISFVAIWVFNYMFTATLLAAFPQTLSLR
jgi:phospholipid/cholesterol/gamma-HCH transport system permease protein